jgi:enediyne core biosynthesis thioesterase
MRTFEYRHVISLEETNLVGNVYYVNHVKWQGRCRELFLRAHAPDVLGELSRGFVMATISCRCDYFAELRAFDEVVVRMSLVHLSASRVSLGFEYYRAHDQSSELVARGEQQIACMQKTADGLAPAPVPDSLRQALAAYASDEEWMPCR